jgi:hypothetical protein
VLYWAVQSIYGIVQQWFITGWGKLNDYFPNLPELPEHRRLGYKPPRDMDVDTSTLPPKKQGPFARWWQKQMDNAQSISEERRAQTNPSASTAVTAGAAAATASASATKSSKPTSGSAAKTERPYPRNSPKGRMLAEQAKREQAAEAAGESADLADMTESATDPVATGEATNGGTPGRKKRATK